MSSDQLPNRYPNCWVESGLPDICTPKQWKTISTKDLTSHGYVVYGANGRIGYYSSYTHEHPTLMITCRGATCGNLHISVPCSYINGNAMAIDDLPEEFIGLKYLYYALKARGLDDAISGSAQPQITRQGLSEVNIRIPSLAEQKQIAAKLDELLAQVDTLKTRLDAIPAILKRFRQSVLAAAVSGRLTKEWRARSEKAESYTKFLTDKKIDFADEASYEVPSGWCWSALGDLVTIQNNQRIPLKKADRDKRPGEYPYYGAFGVIDDIDDFIFDGRYLLLAEDGKNLESRIRPIALIADGKFWVNNHAHVLSEIKGMSLDYLLLYLNSPNLDLTPFLTGVDQVKLNRKAMVLIPTPVPPSGEQTEIVRCVEQLFAFADQIEQRVKDAQARVNHLTQSILAKAFRGELTAEWREQNPDLISGENSAEALLERIKLEREKVKPVKRARKNAGGFVRA